MSFGPINSHVQLGCIMQTDCQTRSERSLKQLISLSSTRVTRASPNSMSQASAIRQSSWDTPGSWSTTPTSTGAQVRSNWHAAQITADRPKVIAAAWTSVGEVQSGPVLGHFCRTGDRTVRSLTKILGPGPGTATDCLYRSGPGPDRVQTVPALFIYLFIQD